jgi:hypothetical protein
VLASELAEEANVCSQRKLGARTREKLHAGTSRRNCTATDTPVHIRTKVESLQRASKFLDAIKVQEDLLEVRGRLADEDGRGDIFAPKQTHRRHLGTSSLSVMSQRNIDWCVKVADRPARWWLCT